MPQPVCRLAVIGLGRWGQIMARTLSGNKVPGAELTAVVSSKERSQLTDTICAPCIIYPDIEQLLDDKKINIDGAIITTPTLTQIEYASRCLSAGLPVLAEKPFITSSTCHDGFAPGPGNIFMVDFTHLYNPAWQAVRAAAMQESPIVEIKATAGQLGPFRADTSVLWDWGSHDIALLLSLIPGHWHAAHCHILRQRMASDSTSEEFGETTNVELTHSSGAKFHGCWSNSLSRKTKRFQIKLQNGTRLQYDDVHPANKALHISANGALSNLPFQPGLPVNKVLEAFCHHIVQQTQPLTGFKTACEVYEILLQLEKQIA